MKRAWSKVHIYHFPEISKYKIIISTIKRKHFNAFFFVSLSKNRWQTRNTSFPLKIQTSSVLFKWKPMENLFNLNLIWNHNKMKTTYAHFNVMGGHLATGCTHKLNKTKKTKTLHPLFECRWGGKINDTYIDHCHISYDFFPSIYHLYIVNELRLCVKVCIAFVIIYY